MIENYFFETEVNADILLRDTNNEGEKSYKCNQCDYASSQAGSLTFDNTFENAQWRKATQMQPMHYALSHRIIKDTNI